MRKLLVADVPTTRRWPIIEIVPGSAIPPPTNDRLEKLQSDFGQRFPAAYVSFLQRLNGAKLRPNEVVGAGRPFVIERFLPVLDDFQSDKDNGWADMSVVVAQLDARIFTDPDTARLDLVPIAALFAGDFLVLDYRTNPQNPSVGVWDHEASEDFEPVVSPVAADFAGLEELIGQPAA